MEMSSYPQSSRTMLLRNAMTTVGIRAKLDPFAKQEITYPSAVAIQGTLYALRSPGTL